ncbi:MAG: phosphate signaling complex protein PhoU [Gammaproteobacteria bacterium]
MTDRGTNIIEGHTVRTYDADIGHLRSELLAMGGLVIDQVALSAQAVVLRKADLWERVIKREQDVNRYDTVIEGTVFQLLAKRAPMGVDLRVVLAYHKAATDVERCGDEAKKIAKIARKMAAENAPQDEAFNERLKSMSGLATQILREVLEALDDADEQRAVQAAQSDAEIDAAYEQALDEIHSRLITDPTLMASAAEMVTAIKALERIGDHAKNIGRYVVFIVQGKDVRHVKTSKLDRELGP